MNSVSLLNYVKIGTCIRFLQDADEKYDIHGSSWVIANLNELFRHFDALDLKVTKNYANDLKHFKTELEKEINRKNLTVDESKKLKGLIIEVRKVFEAEMKDIVGYIPTEKKIDLKRLTKEINKLFSPNIFESLSDISKNDFNEAGMCIAFERPTAAAFHTLRGTEDVLKIYYKKYFRSIPTGKTWGQILNDLKNKTTGKKPNQTTLSHLVNIKDSFRNPTQHPEKIYDIYEVQDLLNICVEVINRMIKEIEITPRQV